MGFFVIKKYQ